MIAQEGESPSIPVEFVGYGLAAEYLKLRPNTLSSYVTKGTGPRAHRRVLDGQYYRPVFLRADLDEWMAARPGQGARTDLVKIDA